MDEKDSQLDLHQDADVVLAGNLDSDTDVVKERKSN